MTGVNCRTLGQKERYCKVGLRFRYLEQLGMTTFYFLYLTGKRGLSPINLELVTPYDCLVRRSSLKIDLTPFLKQIVNKKAIVFRGNLVLEIRALAK